MAWDPLRDLLATQERLESLFSRASGWTPMADLYETPTGFVLTVEVPGLSRSDVQIEVHDDTLVLRGERTAIECTERFHQLERGHGQFARSFRFSQPVNADGITADLADGVLTIVIPKAAPPDARRVAVR
jgi:HSP20 family protein